VREKSFFLKIGGRYIARLSTHGRRRGGSLSGSTKKQVKWSTSQGKQRRVRVKGEGTGPTRGEWNHLPVDRKNPRPGRGPRDNEVKAATTVGFRMRGGKKRSDARAAMGRQKGVWNGNTRDQNTRYKIGEKEMSN